MIPAGDFVVGSPYGTLLPVHQFTLGLTSKARGGSAIGVATSGLDVMEWVGRIDDGQFKVTGPGPETTVVAVPGADTATFAFDRNMNPAVCWNAADGARLYWFDSSIPGYTTTFYPGVTHAQVVHDDVRDIAESRSDVVLSYRVGPNVYCRQQRDRYLVEYLVANIGTDQILGFGMSDKNRLIFKTVRN